MAVYRYVVTLGHTVGEGPSQNVWHIGDRAPAGFDPVGPVSALRAFYGAVAPYLNTTTTIQGASEYVNVADQSTVAASWGAVMVGTGGGTPMPAHDSIVVGWRTALAARRGRGRTFVGPLSNVTLQSDGTIAATALSAIQAAADNLVLASNAAAAWGLVVYGRSSLGVPVPKVGRYVTSARVRDIYGVMRSRRG